jgi:hypothetical protein
MASWLFANYVAVAGLVAIAATLFYGLAYTQIYDSVNAAPEEVGFTPTQILTHAAAGGIALVILVGLTTFLVCMPAAPVRDDPASWAEPGSWRLLLLNLLFTGLALFLLLGLAEMTNAPRGLLLTLAGVNLVFFFAGGLRFRRRHRWVVEPRPLHFSFERYSILAAVAVPVGLFFTIIGIFTQANVFGDRLANGFAVRGSEVVGMAFLGVKAEPALVSWMSRPAGVPEMPRCVIYLGRSDGDSVFYDWNSGSTFHVPSASVAVELRGDLDDCHGPVNLRRPSIHPGKDGGLVCRRGGWESPFPPDFRFEWLSDGGIIPVSLKKKFAPRISAYTLRILADRSVHCRITASNGYGRASASSPPVLLDKQGQLLR